LSGGSCGLLLLLLLLCLSWPGPFAVQADMEASAHSVRDLPLPPSPNASVGALLWNRTLGGFSTEYGFSVVACSSGGFAIAGLTASYGAGDLDMWLIRTDANGQPLWNRTYGGEYTDDADSVIECSDGGFALVGYTGFATGDLDLWVVKTDGDGNQIWNCTFGGVYVDEGTAIVECAGGGFAISGTTFSFDAGGDPIHDGFLLRVDANGNRLWNQTYGAAKADILRAIVKCDATGFALAGVTTSYGGVSDAWLVRTDANGNALWNRTYGGDRSDEARSLVRCADGGFAMAGCSASYAGFDADAWLIRTDAAGNHLWNRTYGGPDEEWGLSVVEYGGGGFAIAGYTRSCAKDVWVVRTDAAGCPLWNRTYGGPGYHDDCGRSIVETADGGFAVAGDTDSFGGGFQVYLLRISEPPIYWLTALTDHVIECGAGFSYAVEACGYGGLSRWWLADSSFFSIDSQGVVVNATFLPANVYVVQVCVNDSRGEVLAGRFTVTVQDTTSPIWLQVPVHQDLRYGEPFSYQLQAFDLSGIASWQVNDTTSFAVNNEGLVTNRTALVPGRYGLLIRATDPYGNSITAAFKVEVAEVPPPPPIPGFPILAAILGVIIATTATAILRRKGKNEISHALCMP